MPIISLGVAEKDRVKGQRIMFVFSLWAYQSLDAHLFPEKLWKLESYFFLLPLHLSFPLCFLALPLNLAVMLMTLLPALAVSHNTTYQHRTGVWVFLNSLSLVRTHTRLHTLCYYAVDLWGTCAEVQIENMMCANAFRTEVRPVLFFFCKPTVGTPAPIR